jgi:hypothetical protein
MIADTKSVFIQASPQSVVRFLRDPENLPRWAVGFAKGVRKDHGGWVVMTGGGEMGMRIVADEATGVVDFFMCPAPGIEILAGSRVLPNLDGTEYVFTQFQAPGSPADQFMKSVEALRHELTVLKALLEVECPL